jgi:hypothetical protein
MLARNHAHLDLGMVLRELVAAALVLGCTPPLPLPECAGRTRMRASEPVPWKGGEAGGVHKNQSREL